ncbi:MAG TPA: alpha/beta hydrolase-fold protein [Gammaproteobacteria bacterium]|jgi:phospholipase/carboxylesterase
MRDILPCIEINPPGAADFSVIWLHGLGANGHDFEPIVPQLGLPENPAVRFVFPHAPARPVTINNGYVMPAWFDILTLERLSPVDETGIEASIGQINALIEREKSRGVSAGRIVVAGFSQGGVIALHTAARYPEPLAGVIALSTYLPLHERLTPDVVVASSRIPVFMAHGRFDSVLSIKLGRISQGFLKSILPNIEWHEYAMDHGVCLEEIQDLSRWLQNKILIKKEI